MHAIIWMHMTPKQFIRPNVVWNDVVLTAEFATMSRTDVDWSVVVARLGEPVTDHESPTMGEATVSRRAGSWTTRISAEYYY